MIRLILDRGAAYTLRAALINLLRLVEDALELGEDERALREPRRRRAARYTGEEAQWRHE